jgi:hypothetical protein
MKGKRTMNMFLIKADVVDLEGWHFTKKYQNVNILTDCWQQFGIMIRKSDHSISFVSRDSIGWTCGLHPSKFDAEYSLNSVGLYWMWRHNRQIKEPLGNWCLPLEGFLSGSGPMQIFKYTEPVPQGWAPCPGLVDQLEVMHPNDVCVQIRRHNGPEVTWRDILILTDQEADLLRPLISFPDKTRRKDLSTTPAPLINRMIKRNYCISVDKAVNFFKESDLYGHCPSREEIANYLQSPIGQGVLRKEGYIYTTSQGIFCKSERDAKFWQEYYDQSSVK